MTERVLVRSFIEGRLALSMSTPKSTIHIFRHVVNKVTRPLIPASPRLRCWGPFGLTVLGKHLRASRPSLSNGPLSDAEKANPWFSVKSMRR